MEVRTKIEQRSYAENYENCFLKAGISRAQTRQARDGTRLQDAEISQRSDEISSGKRLQLALAETVRHVEKTNHNQQSARTGGARPWAAPARTWTTGSFRPHSIPRNDPGELRNPIPNGEGSGEIWKLKIRPIA